MNNAKSPSGVLMKLFAVLAGVFCLAIATGAGAKPAAGPCAADAAKLCQGMQPGGGQVGKCLRQHAGELSPECKDSIAKIKAKAKSFREACGADARKFCRDEKRGGGRIMKCLASHQDELAPDCREMMNKPVGGRRQQQG
ncbi:MAG: cysteine rich repeat-containing protein [Gallionella sp.]